MKNHIKNAMILGIIPLAIMSAISFVLNKQGMDPFQTKSTFIVGLIVTAVAASSVIYEADQWSLRKKSLIHFGIMLLTVYPLLLLSGWYPVHGVWDALKIFGLFILMGSVLWTLGYLVSTRLVKKKG